MTDHYLRTESDRSRLIGFISGLDLSKPRKVAISEVRSKRSDAQNRLLWMWNNEIQAFMRDSHGECASADEWHEILVSKLWPAQLHRVCMPDGSSYKVGRAKTRNFNQNEMTTYLEMLDAYCASSIGLVLTHPADLMMAAYGKKG